MALNAATTPLVITLTQGGADAFVQGSVLTGLSGRQAYNVRAIFIEFTATNLQAMAQDCDISVAITRRSKTAMPTLADTDVLYKQTLSGAFTTSGLAVVKGVDVYEPDGELPIVEETIYAQLDSTTLGTNTAIVRLEVEIDTMSDIDRLNLITRSLS